MEDNIRYLHIKNSEAQLEKKKMFFLHLNFFFNEANIKLTESGNKHECSFHKNNQADLCEKRRTHSSQHDANYQPPEGPDADEWRGAAAWDLGQSPQGTQEDGEETRLQQLTLPTWTHHRASKCFSEHRHSRPRKEQHDSHFFAAKRVQTTDCWGFTGPNSRSKIRLPALWPHLSVMSCSQFNQDHVPFE